MAREDVRTLLVQQGLLEALGGADSIDSMVSERDKQTMLEKAHSAIILSLGDKVLRQVSKEKSAVGVWA